MLALALSACAPEPEPEPAPAPVAEPSAAPERRGPNRLAGEPSPYLQAHADNPVDWYPWGPEAMKRAKDEGKPIFLSIGYSTCHWCHVMEEESFEDEAVAAFLNAHFVSIKVDREQRPDLDALYSDAVAAMGHSTGWPLTVFLTPQLEPFFGGTYFPPTARGRRPGFMDVLGEVSALWEKGQAKSRGRGLMEALRRKASEHSSAQRFEQAELDAAMGRVAAFRDDTRGGFGSRAKFPNAPLLGAELARARAGDADARAHLAATLDAMMRGGIRDHLSGSFHRYTVDANWHVPHFERTLYDNAQLAALYVEAGLFAEREDWVALGRAVLDDLVSAWRVDAGFISGFDADDAGGEGTYYTWTREELEAALGEQAERVARDFGVAPRGEGALEGRSVLDPGASVDVLSYASTFETMAKARAGRPQPAHDDKVLVSWNGLAIAALADAGRWLDEARYVEAASEVAQTLWAACWDEADAALARGVRGDASLGPGFATDYASLGIAFVRLHAATGDLVWLERAAALLAAIEQRFAVQGRVRRSEARHDVPVHALSMRDGARPSGGAMTVRLAFELGTALADEAVFDRGVTMLEAAAADVAAQPADHGSWLGATAFSLMPLHAVVLAGAPQQTATADLWAEIRPLHDPRFVVVRLPAQGAPGRAVFEGLAKKQARGGRSTVYVCEQGSCKLPTSEASVLREQLAAAAAATP